MNTKFSEEEIGSVESVISHIEQGDIAASIAELENLKNKIYASIPDKQRISRGITWVLKRISTMIDVVITDQNQKKFVALTLYENLEQSDRLTGAPIFLMASYGKQYPNEVLVFFEDVCDSSAWEVREFAAGGFQQVLKPNKDDLHSWLKDLAKSENHNKRRFVSELLRPVATGRWLREEPQYSIAVLQYLFRETHPYPRTSVGNNLSDLSKVHPELIFSIVDDLVKLNDKNSYWIANRACRNLVKQHPNRVMDALGVEEYHYKDRHYYRGVDI